MSFGVLRRVTSLTRCKGKHYFLFCKFFRRKMQKKLSNSNVKNQSAITKSEADENAPDAPEAP